MSSAGHYVDFTKDSMLEKATGISMEENDKYGVGQPATVNAFTDPDAFCPCVSDHNPNVITYHKHHIWPLGMGGPDTSDNVLLLCPTVHAAVHHLIRDWVKVDGEPDWDIRKRFGLFARDLAEQAYLQWVEAGRP